MDVVRYLVCAVFVCFPQISDAEVELLKGTPYERHTISDSANDPEVRAFQYLVLPPEQLEPGKQYPLVLFLHGAGERGDDPRKVIVHLPERMLENPYRERFQCFFVAPQCPEQKMWIEQHWSEKESVVMPKEPTRELRMAYQALEESLKRYPVDLERVYVTGLSMGGYGAWELAMRHPMRFAALVAICGGGDESSVERLQGLPIWAAHGDQDATVPVERSRRMVEALRQVGAEPRYSEYKGIAHDSWKTAYRIESGILDWMFRQRRKVE